MKTKNHPTGLPEIEPVAAFKQAISVKRLPKAQLGKTLHATMQKIADCEDWKTPATIDDPDILDEITDYLKEQGMAGGQGWGSLGFVPRTYIWLNEGFSNNFS